MQYFELHALCQLSPDSSSTCSLAHANMCVCLGAGKFLIGKDGDVIGRWFSTTKPEEIEDEIVKALEA